MNQQQIERINELARKAKTAEGLTEEDVELLQRLAENLRNKNRG